MKHVKYILGTLFICWIVVPGPGIQEWWSHSAGETNHDFVNLLNFTMVNLIAKIGAIIIWIFITFNAYLECDPREWIILMAFSLMLGFGLMGEYNKYWGNYERTFHYKLWVKAKEHRLEMEALGRR